MGSQTSQVVAALDTAKQGSIDQKSARQIIEHLPKKLAKDANKFMQKVTDVVDMKALVKFFEDKKVDVRGVLGAIKKARAPKEEAIAFSEDEIADSNRIEAMAARPKGKPTPEQASALKAQKAAKAKFFDAVRARCGLEKKGWSDKKLGKALTQYIKNSESKKNGTSEVKAAVSLEPPSGTRDFYPDDMAVRNWLFGEFRKVGIAFGFQEYDAPVLEHAELYKRKAGEEITQQMYNFIDKDNAEVTLRPEMTPTLARMVLKRMDESGEIRDMLPLKWFSVPQCWRFETTQRGRKREHYQWNMDIVGIPGATAELELLAAITTFFSNIGVTANDIGIRINSRKVLGAITEAAGVPKELFAPVCVIIDKLDKIGPEAVTEELTKKNVPKQSSAMILKAMACGTIDELASLCEGKVDMSAVKEMKQLFQYAKDYGFSDYLIFDASVVRGLAYYTGIVFEGFDKRGELRAICGGGRYDRLLSLYGSSKEIPCAGFGFGDCVVMELLKELKLMPKILEKCKRQVDYVVAPYNTDLFGAACSVAALLRKEGFSVDMLQEPSKKVRMAFSYADRAGAKKIVFVAPDEWKRGAVTVKDLRNSGDKNKGEEVKVEQLVSAQANQ